MQGLRQPEDGAWILRIMFQVFAEDLLRLGRFLRLQQQGTEGLARGSEPIRWFLVIEIVLLGRGLAQIRDAGLTVTAGSGNLGLEQALHDAAVAREIRIARRVSLLLHRWLRRFQCRTL